MRDPTLSVSSDPDDYQDTGTCTRQSTLFDMFQKSNKYIGAPVKDSDMLTVRQNAPCLTILDFVMRKFEVRSNISTIGTVRYLFFEVAGHLSYIVQ